MLCYTRIETEQSLRLVMDLRMKARENLQILFAVLILAILGDLRASRTPLLLRLADLDPLLGREVLPQLREDVAREPQPVEQRAVLDGVQDYVVVRPAHSLDTRSLSLDYRKQGSNTNLAK